MSNRETVDQEQADTIISLLRELVAWTKLANRPQVAQRFTEILNSDEKRLVYEYSDGGKGVRDLSGLTGVSKALVSAWWRDWDQLGMMERSASVPGRRERLVSLRALGIEVPPLAEHKEE